MSRYNLIERKVASLLNRHPMVKGRIKRAYQSVNYQVFGDKEFTHETHPDVELVAASERFDVSDTGGEQFVGYYDVAPWNDAMTAGLYHEVRNTNHAEIVTYCDGNRTVIADSAAWNYQQGSRTQWHPTLENRIMFNDVESGAVVARRATVAGEIERTYARPIQAICPTGEEFLSLNYRRLDRNRPDYGYGTDDGAPLKSPDTDGLWSVDLRTGEHDLVVSLCSLIEATGLNISPDNHYINHALYDPTGTRFAFLHRWVGKEGRVSRLYVADLEGNRDLLLDDRVVSHYCWLDENRLFVWGCSDQYGNGYHIIDVNDGSITYVWALDDWDDGHPSFSPNKRYVATDTYTNRDRKRHLLLYDRNEETVKVLGQFFEPLEYTGSNRCDLHPRWSPDGTAISIDSAHDGIRRSYIVDVRDIV